MRTVGVVAESLTDKRILHGKTRALRPNEAQHISDLRLPLQIHQRHPAALPRPGIQVEPRDQAGQAFCKAFVVQDKLQMILFFRIGHRSAGEKYAPQKGHPAAFPGRHIPGNRAALPELDPASLQDKEGFFPVQHHAVQLSPAEPGLRARHQHRLHVEHVPHEGHAAAGHTLVLRLYEEPASAAAPQQHGACSRNDAAQLSQVTADALRNNPAELLFRLR